MKYYSNGTFKEGNIENKDGAVYEVLRVINSKPLFLKEHIERLEASLEKKVSKVKEGVENFIKYYPKENYNIFIQYNPKSDIYYIYESPSSYPSVEMFSTGIDTVSIDFKRKCPNQKIYSSNYKEHIREYLSQKNAFEAILVDNDIISEGSKSNIFFIENDTLLTPKAKDILMGVTRKKIIQLARENNIIIIEGDIRFRDINKFNGAFLSGTSIDILPIRKIDNLLYDTPNNELYQLLLKSYNDLK